MQEDSSKSFMNTSGSQTVKNKINPFRKSTRTPKEDFFNVDFEDSQGQVATSCTLSQNSEIRDNSTIFKNPNKSGINKNNVQDPFVVDFEESREASLQDTPGTLQTESQKSLETFSQDTTFNFKKPKLFKNPKLHSNSAFDIDFEESGQILSQNMQQSQAPSLSQKSMDIISQGETGKSSFFQKNTKHFNNAFEVDFEESCQSGNVGQTQGTQESQSPESERENVENTSVTFERPDPFREAKQKRLNKRFDVNFEVSGSISNVFSATPTKSGILPFRKSSNVPKEDDFDINFNETDVEKHVDDLTEKSGQVMCSASPVSRSQSFTSGLNGINATGDGSELNQSSFNDENLRQWMSDQSEDEIEIGKGSPIEGNIRKTLPPGDISPPPDIMQEEDHSQQLHVKLKEIIDSARSGKFHVKSPLKTHENLPQKPKRLQNNRNTVVKPTLKKPAPFATKRLYNHIITKIRPKYGIDSVIHAEEFVIYVCDVVKTVVRRKAYQKKMINDLKMEMAKMGIIETTYQFYEFVREFLPYEFRLKSVPCIQPGTNIVYPPKDAINPFQKII